MTIAGASGRRWPVISALGVVQIFTWGSTFYLLTVLAGPIAADTGWPLGGVVGALSAALLTAGLVSPSVGAAIARHGGRPVLAAGCGLIATGLTVLALAPSLAVFYAGWLLLGCGMAAGLYDPAFAALGRLYGQGARSAITALTLWGGFASTVCWPLSTLLLESFGWRGTAAAYAAIHILVTLPLVLWFIPRPDAPVGTPRSRPADPEPLVGRERTRFRLFAAVLVLTGLIFVILSVHLLTFLQAQGYPLAVAVGLGALFGPAQVGARVVEMASGGRHHPIWTLAVSALSASAGLVLLAADARLPGLALVLFGAGNGLLSIARGSLPLALFGAERYPRIMGRLARPALIAQAAAPMVGAALIGWVGPGTALVVMAVLTVSNCGLVLLLWRGLRD